MHHIERFHTKHYLCIYLYVTLILWFLSSRIFFRTHFPSMSDNINNMLRSCWIVLSFFGAEINFPIIVWHAFTIPLPTSSVFHVFHFSPSKNQSFLVLIDHLHNSRKTEWLTFWRGHFSLNLLWTDLFMFWSVPRTSHKNWSQPTMFGFFVFARNQIQPISVILTKFKNHPPPCLVATK